MEVRHQESTEQARAFLERIENREQDTSEDDLRDERLAYADAQKSISEARRSAELHEGLLRIP